MSSLFLRRNGIWYLVYPDKNQRRWLSSGTRCYGKAWAIFRDFKLEHKRHRPERVSDFFSEFLSCASADRKKGTLDLYAHSFRVFIRCMGDKPIGFVSVKDIEKFKTARTQTVSPVSANVEFRTLKAAFNVAVQWGVIEENVFAKCKPLRVAPREPSYLSRDEFDQLLCAIDEEGFRDLVFFAVQTVMRRSEIINLEWSDLDFDRRVVHVRNKQNFTVKGGRPRVVPMSPGVYDLLLGKTKRSSFVFVHWNGCPFKAGYISHKFKGYARKCDFPEAIHFHSLRHTGATWLIQEGVSIFAVQRILGHTSAEMTQIYSHLSDQNLLSAIQRIDIPFSNIMRNRKGSREALLCGPALGRVNRSLKLVA